MKQKSTRQPIWLPLAIAVALVVGIFIGSRFTANKPVAENDRKLNAILNLIAQDYVDTTNLHDLIEMSIPEILSNLDPHTSYFSAEDLQAATDDLNGSFSGIGISFVMVNDTIGVVEVIPGGPSEKVGLMPGDKIVMIDDSVATGPKISNGDVIAVSQAVTCDQILWGEIYLVITNAWRVVKTVHPGKTEEKTRS